MDYYNFNPCISDSLELLSTSFPRHSRSVNRVLEREGYPYARAENVLMVTNYSGQSYRHRANLPSSASLIVTRSNAPSSTSLVLKKTTQRHQISQAEYSEYSCNTASYSPVLQSKPPPSTHRPLIRVTVIPTNTVTQPKPHKRRSPPKKLQRIVSNQENSIRAKHVYLIVSGKKREKVYEIKTAGSADFSSSQSYYMKNEHKPVKEKQVIREFLSSLNMDSKKPKAKKKKEKKIVIKESETSFDRAINGMSAFAKGKDCECTDEVTKQPNKSRVRVTGRIGLTTDDRYVLKCAATVDDKPIEATFLPGNSGPEQQFPVSWGSMEGSPTPKRRQNASLECKSPPRYEMEGSRSPTMKKRLNGSPEINSPPRFSMEGSPTMKRRQNASMDSDFTRLPNQKEAVVQADLPPEELYNSFKKPIVVATCNMFRSVETQCYPANFNTVCFSNIDKLKIVSHRDQTIQCDCTNKGLIVQNMQVGQTDRTNCVCQPQDTVMSADIGTSYEKTPVCPSNYSSPLVIISVYPKQDSEDSEEKIVIPKRESKSQSPERGVPKRANRKQSPNKGKEIQPRRSRSPSPSRSPTKIKGSKTEVKTKNNKGRGEAPPLVADKKNMTKKTSKKDKETQMVKEKQSKTNKKVTVRQGQKEQREHNDQREQWGTTRETCTDADCRMKQGMLVTSGSQRYGGQMNTKRLMNWVSADHDVSNVAINIDGENDFYDVLFRRGEITTDLRVRQAYKEQDTQKYVVEGESLHNLYLVADHRKSCFSQPYLCDQPKSGVDETRDKDKPRLSAAPRDSLLIAHRKEFSSNSIIYDKPRSETSCANDSRQNQTFFAPEKHFKGDSCNLPDPVTRDKEIRELLGIQRRQTNYTYNTECTKAAEDRPVQCYYTKKGNSFSMGPFNNVHRVYNVFPKCVYENFGAQADLSEGMDDNEFFEDFSVNSDISTDTIFARHPIPQARNRLLYPVKGGKCNEEKGSPIYRQIIVNRNINVYLQIEQFTKQRPIVLTRKQYDKVKRTIENATLHTSKLNCVCKTKSSGLSVGEVRRKPTQCRTSLHDRDHGILIKPKKNIQADLSTEWIRKSAQTERFPFNKTIYNVLDKKVAAGINTEKKRKERLSSSDDDGKRQKFGKKSKPKNVFGRIENKFTHKSKPKQKASTKELEKAANERDISKSDLLERYAEKKERRLRDGDIAVRSDYKEVDPSESDYRAIERILDKKKRERRIKEDKHALRLDYRQLDPSFSDYITREKLESLKKKHRRPKEDRSAYRETDPSFSDYRSRVKAHRRRKEYRPIRDERTSLKSDYRDTDISKSDFYIRDTHEAKKRLSERKAYARRDISEDTVVDLRDSKLRSGWRRPRARKDTSTDEVTYMKSISEQTTREKDPSPPSKPVKSGSDKPKPSSKDKPKPSSKDKPKTSSKDKDKAKAGKEKSSSKKKKGASASKSKASSKSKTVPSSKSSSIRTKTSTKSLSSKSSSSKSATSKGKSGKSSSKKDSKKTDKKDSKKADKKESKQDLKRSSSNLKSKITVEKKNAQNSTLRLPAPPPGYCINPKHPLFIPCDQLNRYCPRRRGRTLSPCTSMRQPLYLPVPVAGSGVGVDLPEPCGSTEAYTPNPRLVSQSPMPKIIEIPMPPPPPPLTFVGPYGGLVGGGLPQTQYIPYDVLSPVPCQYPCDMNQPCAGSPCGGGPCGHGNTCPHGVCPNLICNKCRDACGDANQDNRILNKSSCDSSKRHHDGCKYCKRQQDTTLCRKCGRFTKKCDPEHCYYYCGVEGKGPVVPPLKPSENLPRHAASSTEIRYTSVSYMKHVTFSSLNVAKNEQEKKPSVANILMKNYESDSIHTIFKGHKKSPTPNLGTSVCSVYSGNSDKSSKSKLEVEESRRKKPFLKRLMSCLVMHSKTSDIKMGKPKNKAASINSTVDSYHISTSLGAVDITSSIYDTSASFYSNHSVHPISSKIKRGFLSSVRGFLTNRRN